MDIIHILPDSIANQIAAGEVIQRPASVVKELIENAIDAGADAVQVIVKEAGRSLIQVKDNGCGMSAVDARLSFGRHATSKIRVVQDLFTLRTIGFRGEALASIAAVAQVELKTRLKNEETGTLIQISASQVERQEPVATNVGSIFSVKNLFYNVPVRRKFLKSNETEFKNILIELDRVALVNPHIAFSLFHNDEKIVVLPISNIKQRIVQSMGEKVTQHFLPIDIKTSFIRIYGFISSPNSSRKRGALQYFFVNGRYMRHAYFHRAVIMAFEPFLPAGEQPNYFLYMEVDPANIDVNIHPTKTEIKFENEPMLFQVLFSVVKEALAIPTFEFDQEGIIDIPAYDKKDTMERPLSSPVFRGYSGYNPFCETNSYDHLQTDLKQLDLRNSSKKEDVDKISFDDLQKNCLQYQGRYLVLSFQSGLTIIDQHRAHIRVLFDDYLVRIRQKHGVSQKMIFPEIISFSPKEAIVLVSILEDLTFIGFDLVDLGNRTYSISGIPFGWGKSNIVDTLHEIMDKVLLVRYEIKKEVMEALALAVAHKMAVPYGKNLSEEEIRLIIGKLFSSASPYHTPDGKRIIYTLSEKELNKRFI